MSSANESTVQGARTASRGELRRRLSSAPAAWLSQALENPELGPPELMLVLRNPAAPAAVLERIGASRTWMGHHELRRGLARHAHTPLAVARNLLPHLYSKDWCEIAAHPAANPVIRRQAERLLLACVDKLALGERIMLARRATRGLIPAFLTDANPRVIQALLGNPRLVEIDLLRLASDVAAGAEVLRSVAEHPVWGQRRDLRLALIRRPELPVQTAFHLARKMDRRDLRMLVEDDKVPLVVRVGIERRLREDPGGRSPRNRPTGAGEWS
ncbi:MAG: hypothetical protein E2P01_02095 [Acidobacteria bacterium]|nr:MAG: hypothetical protein E2P01_02095 [Acidobacteriota bacterium]